MSTPSLASHLQCDDHGHRVELGQPVTLCPSCGSLLEVCYDLSAAATNLAAQAAAGRGTGIWRWRALLPLSSQANPVTLGEGDSPLLDVPDLARQLGLHRLL